jgi:hypothetical protein
MTAEARSHESATDSYCEVAGRFSMVTRAQESDVSCWMTPRPYSGSTMRVSLRTNIRVAVVVVREQFGNPGTERLPFEASNCGLVKVQRLGGPSAFYCEQYTVWIGDCARVNLVKNYNKNKQKKRTPWSESASELRIISVQ